MKHKILMLSLLVLIFFNSCSSDSNSTTQNLDPNTILPIKVINENLFDESITYDFYYNQNKIDYIHYKFFSGMVNGFDYDIDFTYTGNLITEIKSMDTSGNVILDMLFTYQNNKLINKKVFNNGQQIYNIDYIHNSNNTISITNNSYNYIYTITNNLVTDNQNGPVFYSSTHSPYKNITGIDKCFIDIDLYDNSPFQLEYLFTSTNNNNILSTSQHHYAYDYNDILFPITISKYEGGGLSRHFQIFYQ